MGIATERKLAAVRAPGVHDLSTVRALPTVSHDVSDSQILDVKTAAPLRLVKPAAARPGPTLNDLVALNFFEDGKRQEAEGRYTETEHVPIRSLDHVPRRWGAVLVAMFLVVAAAGAGGACLGWRAFAMLGLVA